MAPSRNLTLVAAGVLGAAAVLLGAYAAHGLRGALAEAGRAGDDLVRRVASFETGARYQLASAAALLAVALSGEPLRGKLAVPAALLTLGTVVFSGLLYALAWVGPEGRWLGAVVPLGGLAMTAAWGWLALLGLRAKSEPAAPGADDLVRVEELLTHQQRLLQHLDESVRAVRDEQDRLAARLRAVEESAQRLAATQPGADFDPDERPPHY